MVPRASRSASLSLSLLVFGAALGLCPANANAQSFIVRTFRPWAGYAIPNGLWLTGDFNGDGLGDVFHAVAGTHYAHVWTSNGDGTYRVGTFSPWPNYAIPNGVWLTGDFNADGLTDVFHAVANTNYANVWLSNGDGTFRVSSFQPWPGYAIPNGLWMTGDFDGDGRTDVVHAVANTDYANVWLSRGDGTFRVSSFRPWRGYAIPNGVWLTGDFNGDGRTDIVHAVANTDYVNVWTSNGNGTFTVAGFRPWAGYAIPNGLWLTGDFNGDGRTDIVHAVANTDYVNVWTSNGNSTFAVRGFRPWAGYAIPNGVWLSGDFNGDGLSDIVHAVANTDYANVWLSRGNATFAISSFSPWAGYAIPNGLWLAGDLSGDGKDDIFHAVNATDYVHPWISNLASPVQVAFDGLEVTQGIQNMSLSVPLVATKATWVRAYLSVPAGGPVNVTGRLRIAPGVLINSTNTLTLDPGQNGPAQVRWKRSDLTRSLNFVLPAQAIAAGSQQFRLAMVRNAATGRRIPCTGCATGPVSVQMLTAAPMRLRIIGLQYTAGTPAVTIAPRGLDYGLLQSWLRRAYPIGQLFAVPSVVTSTNAWPFGCGAANAQVATIRAFEVSAGADARTHYYGLVSDASPGAFMRGCAAVPGAPDPSAIASGPTGTNTWGWDTDGSYGDWYGGHEIGHTLGRSHLGSGCGDLPTDPGYPFPNGQLSGPDSAFVGLDVGNAANAIAPAALPGTTWHDVMSYCVRQWLSSYTYDSIRGRLTAEDLLSPGPFAAGPSPTGALGGGSFALVLVQQSDSIKYGRRSRPSPIVGSRKQPVPTRGMAKALPAPEPAMQMPDTSVAALTPSVTGPPVVERTAVQAADTLPVQPAAERAGVTMERPTQPMRRRSMQAKIGGFIHIVATVNISKQTAAIQFVQRVSRVLIPPTPGELRARVILKDSAGRTLAETPVAIGENTDRPEGEDRTGLVDVAVPYVSETRVLELLLGDKVVDSRRASRHAPTVDALRISGLGARRATTQGPVLIEWRGHDLDGDTLTYAVELSFDGGKTWEVNAVGLKEPRFNLDVARIKDRRTVQVRVIANDGFNNSTPASQALTMPQR